MGLLDAPSLSAGLKNAVVRPRARPILRAQETVLSAFASGHGWTATGNWAASNLNDTTDTGWAAQVATGTTDGAATGCNFQNLGITSFDPAGKTFVVYLQVSDPARLGGLTLYLGTSSAFTDAQQLTALGGSGQMLLANEWYPVMFTYDGSTQLGTGPGTSVTAAKLRFADKGSSAPVSVKVGGLSYLAAPSQWTNGVVSITIDDGLSSLLTIAQPALSKYRYRATVFPIVDQLGTTGFVTTAQLQNLEQGLQWEVGGHASTLVNHQAGHPALSASALESELSACRSWLADNGFHSGVLAYPQGTYSAASLAACRRYFSAARTTYGSQKEVFPPADPMRIRSFSVTRTDTLVTVKALIDAAQTYRHHLVLTFHDFVTTPSATTQWATADFQALVDYIATKSIAVRPLGEALAAA